MSRYYENTNPLKEGKKRYTATYTGFGIDVKFKTDIDEVSIECAKAYFNKFYPSAKLIQIKEK